VSGVLLTALTFAWVLNRQNIDQITLVAGRAEARVQGYMFKRQYTGLSTYANATPDLNAAQVPSSSGQLIFTFEDTAGTVFGDLDFEDLYYDENSLNASAIPSYYVELQVRTVVEDSYIRATLWLEDYDAGETEPDFTDFAYRYHIAGNNPTTPIDYATPGNVATLNSKTLNNIEDDYNSTTGIPISDNANSYMQITIPPAQVDFYDSHFARSAIIEITPDPLALSWFLKETDGLVNNQQILGCRLAVTFEYSTVPFGA
jgi:hypothetical protein